MAEYFSTLNEMVISRRAYIQLSSLEFVEGDSRLVSEDMRWRNVFPNVVVDACGARMKRRHVTVLVDMLISLCWSVFKFHDICIVWCEVFFKHPWHKHP
jgi:hypothetical protein